jgi:hypothetical protein
LHALGFVQLKLVHINHLGEAAAVPAARRRPRARPRPASVVPERTRLRPASVVPEPFCTLVVLVLVLSRHRGELSGQVGPLPGFIRLLYRLLLFHAVVKVVPPGGLAVLPCVSCGRVLLLLLLLLVVVRGGRHGGPHLRLRMLLRPVGLRHARRPRRRWSVPLLLLLLMLLA